MAYIGGKSKGARYIVALLNHPAFNNVDYVEPFIGYAHILSQVYNKKSYRAFDLNKNVITLHNFISSGRTDFPQISKEDYTALRRDKYILPANSPYTVDELKAFAAFAYTYSGKEWGGYTVTDTSGKRQYDEEKFRYYKKLQERKPYMLASFAQSSYEDVSVKENSLIYADPPYAPFHTDKEYYGGKFNHEKFWSTVRDWILKKNCVVFISEYSAPQDFIAIRTWGTFSTVNQGAKAKVRTEHIFVHKSQFNTLFLLNYKQELTLPYLLYEKLSERSFNEVLNILDVGRNVDHARAFIDVIVKRTGFRSVAFSALDTNNSFRTNPMFPFVNLKASEKIHPNLQIALQTFGDPYPKFYRHVALLAWTLATGTLDKELYEMVFELIKPENKAKAVRVERCFTSTVDVENSVLLPLMRMGGLGYLQDEIDRSQVLYFQGSCGADDSPGYLPLPIGIISSTFTYNPLYYERASWIKLQEALKANKGWSEFFLEKDKASEATQEATDDDTGAIRDATRNSSTADAMLNAHLSESQSHLGYEHKKWVEHRNADLGKFVLNFKKLNFLDDFADNITVEVETIRLLQQGFVELDGNITNAEKQRLLESADDFELEHLSITPESIEALKIKKDPGQPSKRARVS